MEHKARIVNVSSWGVWNYNCSCGQNGGGYQSQEYAVAAGRRHERKFAPAPSVPGSGKEEKA